MGTTSTIYLKLYGIYDMSMEKMSDFMLGQKITKTTIQLNVCRKTMYFICSPSDSNYIDIICEISNIYIYIYIYSIISNIHTWYFQQQKIKASSMKAILSILHTGTFLMDCLNEVIEQCHQCPVGNTVLNEEGPNALQGGKDIKAKS